eukprot:2934308-Amphidinium_carterae.2
MRPLQDVRREEVTRSISILVPGCLGTPHMLLFLEPNTSEQLARHGLIIIATPSLFLQWVSFRSAGLCSNSLIYGTALFLIAFVAYALFTATI